jgi:hypothetical protein
MRRLVHGIGLAKAMLTRRARIGGLQGALYGWIDDLLTRRNFGRALSFFITSFSRNSDDLHQWRSYADDGRGVAIGFSAKLFQPIETKDVDPRKNTFSGALRYVETAGTLAVPYQLELCQDLPSRLTISKLDADAWSGSHHHRIVFDLADITGPCIRTLPAPDLLP